MKKIISLFLSLAALTFGAPTTPINNATLTGTAVVPTGGTLAATGSGTIDSTTLLTKTWAAPAAIGTGTPAAATFTAVVAGSTTSLLLGTAGSAVGNIGFRNATSGTATLAPPTGALSTYTVTLPNAASTLPIFGQQITFAGPSTARTVTLLDAAFTTARQDAAQTFTGVQSFTSPDTTTSITTASTSFTAWAGATTLLTIGGTGASASMFAPSTLDSTTSTTGAIRTSGGISAAKAANIGTSLTAGTFLAVGTTDPADAGALRLENAATIAWEASPAGTDVTLTVNSSEQFVFSTTILSPDITTSITTPSTSFTAWAGATTLLTIGGTGASASLFAPSTLDATSSTTGAIRTSGGISAAKAANIGTTLNVAGISGLGLASSSTTNLNLAVSTTGVSSLRVGHGTAPSSPVNGDIWTTTTAMFVRINGSTVQLGAASVPGSDTQVIFNDSSAFGADAGMTYNKTTDVLTTVGGFVSNGAATGIITITGSTSGTLNFTTANATAQSITVSGAAQTTGATVLTLPDMAGANGTFAFINKAQTWTGIQSMTSPDITTSVTTTSTSFTAYAGATTLLTIGGTGASASLFAPSTLDATTSTTGAIRTSGGISAAKALNIGTTITGGGALSIGTSNAATVGTIELGAPTDTTIARSAAGVISVETNIVSMVLPRITTVTSNATPTYNTDTCDVVNITAQAAAITSMTSSRTGTPGNFQQLEFRIKDDGTIRAITWGADFSSGIATLPTTTIAGKTLYMYAEFDTVTGDFMCQATGSYP